MHNNLTNQQLSSKKNLTSRILGIMSILLAFTGISIFLTFYYFPGIYEITKEFTAIIGFALVIFYYTGVIVLANFGLLMGIKELKFSQKRPAIVGIILCLIGLILSLIVGSIQGFMFMFAAT